MQIIRLRRETHLRRQTNQHYRLPKSLALKIVKICLMCHCSPAISLLFLFSNPKQSEGIKEMWSKAHEFGRSRRARAKAQFRADKQSAGLRRIRQRQKHGEEGSRGLCVPFVLLALVVGRKPFFSCSCCKPTNLFLLLNAKIDYQ